MMVVGYSMKTGVMKSGLLLKRGKARRALSLLGQNNAKLNLCLADSLLTISSEEFAKKWNFDPVRGVPLPNGRYQWMPLGKSSSPLTTATATAADLTAVSNRPLQKCATIPSPTDVQPTPSVNTPHSTLDQNNACSGDETKADCAIRQPEKCLQCSRSLIISTPLPRSSKPASLSTVPKINERLTATPPAEGEALIQAVVPEKIEIPSSTSEESLEDSPSTLRQTCITDFMRARKRRASSMELTLAKPHKKPLLQIRA